MEKKKLVPGPTTFTYEDDKCPFCGYVINSATTSGDQPPEPGDVSICFNCTSYIVFDENLKLRNMTDEELLNLSNELLTSLTVKRIQIRRFKQWVESLEQESK